MLLKEYMEDGDEDRENKRILILIPNYMILSLARGLMKNGLNIVGVELLEGQEKDVIVILESFEVLKTKKRIVLHCDVF